MLWKQLTLWLTLAHVLQLVPEQGVIRDGLHGGSWALLPCTQTRHHFFCVEVKRSQTIYYYYHHYECHNTNPLQRAFWREQTGRRRKLHEWYLPVEASMLDEWLDFEFFDSYFKRSKNREQIVVTIDERNRDAMSSSGGMADKLRLLDLTLSKTQHVFH